MRDGTCARCYRRCATIECRGVLDPARTPGFEGRAVDLTIHLCARCLAATERDGGALIGAFNLHAVRRRSNPAD